MNILLDTHTLIWYMEDADLLPKTAVLLIDNPRNNFFISIASLYEIAIKLKIGKLKLQQTLSEYFKDIVSHNILVLPISEHYLSSYIDVPLMPEHRDPFDRLLIATALVDDLTIITTDKKFELYTHLVAVVW